MKGVSDALEDETEQEAIQLKRHLPSVTGSYVVPSGHARVSGALGECLVVVDGARVVVSSCRAGGAMGRSQGGGHQGGEYKCSNGLHLWLECTSWMGSK